MTAPKLAPGRYRSRSNPRHVVTVIGPAIFGMAEMLFPMVAFVDRSTLHVRSDAEFRAKFDPAPEDSGV